MATKTFIGNALAVGQINTWVFGGTWEADDVINVTINTKTISMVAGSTTIATIVTALQVLLDGQVDSDFYAIDWTADTVNLVGTARNSGIPFSCTIATTETGGGAADAQTIDGAASSTGVATQVATGPTFLDNVDNLDTGSLWVDTDSAVFANSAIDCLYGLDQSTIQLTRMDVLASYTGRGGLKRYGLAQAAGFNSRFEQFLRYLTVDCPIVNIGSGEGAGTSQFYLNLQAAQTAIVVNKTAVPAEAGAPAVKLLGTHASNTLVVNRGRVGVADEPGQVSTFATVKLTQTSTPTDSILYIGSGVTLTTVDVAGGTLYTLSGCTTLNVMGGIVYIEGTAAFTTINHEGGTIYYKSSGTIGTLILGPAAKFYLDKDLQAKVITNPIEMHAGCELYDNAGLAIAGGLDLDRVNCNEQNAKFIGPSNTRSTITAI